MKTYQDLARVGERESDVMDFVHSCINMHKSTDLYKTAVIADKYDRLQNATIMNYKKLLYTISGKAVPDNYSANYKLPSKFFNRFTTQQVQYLLGNGIEWDDASVEKKLGEDFDIRLQEIAKEALVGGVAFGFFNLDHLEVFHLREFAPLYDEDNGALRAGVRFWQISADKPLRATLYEEDGITEYAWVKGEGSIIKPKTKYKLKIAHSEADGTIIYDGENYPTFPIVPLFGNPHRQSELVGIREQIDAYDLIKSGFANDLDDASQIYWTIQNAGGMDDIDLVKFQERMKTVKAAVVDPYGSTAEAHTLEVPYNAREAILERLEKDLYKDYMAFNPESVANGATTATQIRAAYEPINSKSDQFEYCIHDFLQGILAVTGIEGEATFTRSIIVNKGEEIKNVLDVADYVSSEYVTRKVLSIMGDADKIEEVLKEMDEENADRTMAEAPEFNPEAMAEELNLEDGETDIPNDEDSFIAELEDDSEIESMIAELEKLLEE